MPLLGETSGVDSQPILNHFLADCSAIFSYPHSNGHAGEHALRTVTERRLLEMVKQRLFERESGQIETIGGEPGQEVGRGMAEQLGRFTILHELGHGGMGTVYAAYDDQLDRKVAVKVLRAERMLDEDHQQRLFREAQAMARLSHPNVATVFEVGRSDGFVFVAMEFIRGESLDHWLETERSWPVVLETFVQAGRGLEAAHRADLVHRDFKPHNVMRTKDGIVKVLDFGLVRVTGEPLGETLDPDLREAELVTHSSKSSLASSLTVTGMVVGTPLYMPPEQHRGAEVDARGDQYSFCVALWQGLSGELPFDRCGSYELMLAKNEGPPAWPSSAPAVPRQVIAALRRGLSVRPDERWASMDRLLQELSWDTKRRRNRWLWGLTGVGVLGMGGLLYQAGASERTQSCTGAEQQLSGIWDLERSEEVEAAILGIDRPYATGVWERTRAGLDGYARDWVAMHTDACEATTVRNEQSPLLLDLRMACLHRAAVDLRVTVDTLAEADEQVVRKAHELTAGLRPLSSCEDTEVLDAEVEPPRPEDADVVDEVRELLARAQSQERAGRYEVQRETIDAAKKLLGGVEYGPILAKVALHEGLMLQNLDHYDAAEATFKRALLLASQHGLREWATRAAIQLVCTVGYEQQQPRRGLEHRSLAEGLSRGRPLEEAFLHRCVGLALETQGKHEEAEAELRAALLLREGHDPDQVTIAQAHINLFLVLYSRGRYEEAETEIRAGLSQLAEALGPGHPIVASYHNNLTAVLRRLGKHEEAEAELRAALSVAEAALGPDDTNVLMLRYTHAIGLSMHGEHARAEMEFRIVLSRWERTLGAEHPRVLISRNALAVALHAQGRYEEAEAEARAVLSLRKRALGPDHLSVASARRTLATIVFDQGRLEEAETVFREVLSSQERALEPDHPDLAVSRNKLALVLLRLDRVTEALPMVEQAWKTGQSVDIPVEYRAEIAFTFARALWRASNPDRDRARVLAEEAVRLYRAAGIDYEDDAEDVLQWLDR